MKILRVDVDERKIGLSRKRVEWTEEQNAAEAPIDMVIPGQSSGSGEKSEKSEKINIAEIGCWRGLSAFQTSRTISDSGMNVQFHIFDSFEGLSEFTPKDESLVITFDKQDSVRRNFAYDFEKVKQNLSQYDFITYYKGWVPSRFNEVEKEEFSFVHIDVDLYEPTYDCMKFFYPRLKSKGIMVFDDYGATTFLGAQKAVDDYLSLLKKDEFFFLHLPSTQAFLIKN